MTSANTYYQKLVMSFIQGNKSEEAVGVPAKKSMSAVFAKLLSNERDTHHLSPQRTTGGCQ